MTSNPIKALLIEDDPDDILLLKDCLAEIGGGKIKLDYADRLSKGLIQLGAYNYDVILLDLNLPDSRGLDTLNTTVKRFPRLPVVVLSGLADDAITIEAVRRGAQDYLVKGEISGPLVLRVLRYAIERKQVEAMVRASEARYRTLVETSPNGIILADLEGKLLFCNQQAVHLHGYANPESMLGIDIIKLVAPEHRRLVALNNQRTLSEGRGAYIEITMLRRDGSQFPAEINTALLRNSTGKPVGFINFTQDITERKKMIDTEKHIVMLEREFIASISRKLRTPLLGLMDSLNSLQDGKRFDAEMQNMSLKQASRDADRFLDAVDELLDFSLLESDRLALNVVRTDLGQVIVDVLRSFQKQANIHQIQLISAPIHSALLVDVDLPRIRRVLCELLENALNFSEKGAKILVTSKAMNDKVIINVIDEGCGIPLEESERIFEKYYQVSHNSKNSTYMGLGLYISRQIVEAHGGSLSVSSQMGAGSTFTLTIPACKMDTAGREN